MTFNKIILASLAVVILSGFTVMTNGVDNADIRAQQILVDEHSVYDFEEGDEGREGPVYLSENDPRAKVPLALLEQLGQ